jgi:hypothetical protein
MNDDDPIDVVEAFELRLTMLDDPEAAYQDELERLLARGQYDLAATVARARDARRTREPRT